MFDLMPALETASTVAARCSSVPPMAPSQTVVTPESKASVNLRITKLNAAIARTKPKLQAVYGAKAADYIRDWIDSRMPAADARSVIRVSIGVDSTPDEIDGFCAALPECVDRLRAGALL